MIGSNLKNIHEKLASIFLEKVSSSVVKEEHPSGEPSVAGGADNSDVGGDDAKIHETELHDAIKEAILNDQCEKILKLIKQSHEIHPDKGVNVASITRQELKSLVLEGKLDEAKASEISKGIDEVLGA